MSEKNSQAESQDRTTARSVWGSFFLFLAVVLFFLMGADIISGLPFSMPRSWYQHRALWVLISLAILGGGCTLLRQRSRLQDSWSPTQTGRRFESVVLYTKPGCHLCDQAKEILWQYNYVLPEISEVDIEDDQLLMEKFGKCIPVVEIDGKIRFRGRVSEILLRRMIEATAPLEQAGPDTDIADLRKS